MVTIFLPKWMGGTGFNEPWLPPAVTEAAKDSFMKLLSKLLVFVGVIIAIVILILKFVTWLKGKAGI